MIVIDLSRIQPGDVLLSTGAAKESKWTKIAQKIIRLTSADFSHAAMFIAPTVLVESSDAGVVFETFSNAAPGDEHLDGDKIRKQFARFNRTTRLKTRLLLDKKPGSLRILGGLPDATKVEIIRPKRLEGASQLTIREHRINLIKALEPLYLQDYPSFAALMRTAPIPETMISALKQLAQGFFGPVYNPGPFCSELVCLLLAFGPGESGATTPSDLASFSGQFVKPAPPIVSDIPDSDAASMSAPDIEKLLSFIPTSFLSPPVARAIAIAQRVLHFIRTGSRNLTAVAYSPTGKDELERLDQWCSIVSDRFWDWHRNAPDCFAGCAEEARKRAANQKSEIIRQLIKPCATIYNCSSQSFGLHRVQESIEALLQRDIDRTLALGSGRAPNTVRHSLFGRP